MQSGPCESKLLMVKKYSLLYFQSLFIDRTHWRQVAKAPCQKNLILICAIGSCIKVVKQIFLVSYWKKMLSSVAVQNQNGHFSVLGNRKIINSLPLRRKLLRNVLLRVRSNKILGHSGTISSKQLDIKNYFLPASEALRVYFLLCCSSCCSCCCSCC
jgi:hypothetical protein